MAGAEVAAKIFGLVQVCILVAIVVGIILHRRRQKEMEDATTAKFNADPRAAIKRTPVYTAAPSASTPAEPALKVTSALPTWDKNTPPHEILGVHPSAPADVVEKAYKKLLKQYHPDRFAAASWGKGYQQRAHHIVLLIQDARDRMTGKKS